MSENRYSFGEARRLVARQESDSWALGTYVVAPWGFESETHYYVISGAAEWLEAADENYRPEVERFTLVDKRTGELSHQHVTRANGRFAIDLRTIHPVGELIAG